MKKVLVCAGGSGGHIFPALAFAEELCETVPGVELHFVGGKLSSNPFFNKSAYPYTEIECGKLSKNPFILLREAKKILKGVFQARKLIHRFQPDLAVGFGSYHTFPALLGAKVTRCPLILHESNSIPGRVNRFFAPFAEIVATQFTEAAQHLKGNVCAAQMPLRKALRQKKIPFGEARAYFGLDPNLVTLAVFGGSQGAEAINRLVPEALGQAIPALQVIHFTGNEQNCAELQKKYAEAGISACVKAFENRMEMTWCAADLLIARAGASTMAELIEFEIPSLLIPYPHAADKHQDFNAALLGNMQAAIVKKEAELDPNKLASALSELHQNRSTMRQRIKEYKSMTNRPSLADLAKKYLQ